MLLLPLDELSLDAYETISSRHESEEQVELETASQYRYFFETLLNVLDSLNPSGGAIVVSHSVSGLPVRPGSYEGVFSQELVFFFSLTLFRLFGGTQHPGFHSPSCCSSTETYRFCFCEADIPVGAASASDPCRARITPHRAWCGESCSFKLGYSAY